MFSRNKLTLAAAAVAIGAMATLTGVYSDSSVTEATDQTATPATATQSVDRDPHSFGATFPAPVCDDDSLACAAGEVH